MQCLEQLLPMPRLDRTDDDDTMRDAGLYTVALLAQVMIKAHTDQSK